MSKKRDYRSTFAIILLTTLFLPCFSFGSSTVLAAEVPGGLTLNQVSSTAVSFRWVPVPDAAGYNIYIGGKLVGSAPVYGTVVMSQYVATGLTPDKKYNFKVKAVDYKGKLSSFSKVLDVTTLPLSKSANLALGKTASADSKYNNAFSAANVVDGNVRDFINTRPMWLSSGTPAPHWIIIDLARIKYVNKFEIVHGPASGYSGHAGTQARDFIIQGSNDTLTWTDLVTVNNNEIADTTSHSIESAAFRYFKLNMLRGNETGGVGICEFRIFSDPNKKDPENQVEIVTTVPEELNLTKDLVKYGIAGINLIPDKEDFDSRPFFEAAMEYARIKGVKKITMDKGKYYFLSMNQKDRHLAISGINDAVIDLNNSDLYFLNGHSTGILMENCERTELKNFTIDFIERPYTQVKVKSVDPAKRLIEYELIPGWKSPEYFNQVRSPYGGEIIRMFVFRDGQRISDVGRLTAEKPTSAKEIKVLNDNIPWTKEENLAAIKPGDIVVYTNRSGGHGLWAQRGGENQIRNVQIYGGAIFGLWIDGNGKNVVDNVSVMPRPGSDCLISTNADAIHISFARENNTVKNCTVIGSCDDGIAVNVSWMAIVDSQPEAKVVKIKKANRVGSVFITGEEIVFKDPITCANTFSARVVSQNPTVEEQKKQAFEFVELTMDKEVPTLPKEAGIYATNPIYRGGGTLIENNSVQQINMGRGIYVAGVKNGIVRGNKISKTNLSGININEEIMVKEWKFAPCENIVVENNIVDNSFMWGAPCGGIVNSGGAILTNSYNAQGVWPTAMALNNIKVLNNTITNSARSGIRVESVNGGEVSGNTISNYGLRVDQVWRQWIPNNSDPKAVELVENEIQQPIIIKTSNVVLGENKIGGDAPKPIDPSDVQPDGFKDIEGHWAKNDILFMVSKGYVKGVDKDYFEPDINITRAQFASILSNSLELKEIGDNPSQFTDVREADWYYTGVMKAFHCGLITGVTQNDFEPNSNITREQMAVMIMRAYSYVTKTDYTTIKVDSNSAFSDEIVISQWAKQAVDIANSMGIIKGKESNAFAPSDTATRAEAVTLIKRFLDME